MLSVSPLTDRALIEQDATAVLAFDDGTRIPCDRFVLRTYCSVLRKLLAEPTVACETDDRGRTVLPLPSQDPGPYWVATDLLHGARAAWQLGLAEVVSAMRCMEFLGCTAFDAVLDARLWALVCHAPLDSLSDHVPRLLRNPALAAATLRQLIKLRPVWQDFVRDVLRPLEPLCDPHLATTVMTYAPNFFPPALVAAWTLAACPRLTAELALRLAAYHGVMYHPCEVTAVLRLLADLTDQRRWNDEVPGLGGLLRMALASLEKYDAMPWAARKVHGSQVKYHDVPAASVCLALETGRLPRVVRLAPWMQVRLCQRDGSFDVHFKPRRLDSSAAACTELQLRVMCFDAVDAPRARCCGEAWYTFRGIGQEDHEWWTLQHATGTLGRPEPISDMLRLRTARQLRLDFFFGVRSVLDHPFDVSQATLAALAKVA